MAKAVEVKSKATKPKAASVAKTAIAKTAKKADAKKTVDKKVAAKKTNAKKEVTKAKAAKATVAKTSGAKTKAGKAAAKPARGIWQKVFPVFNAKGPFVKAPALLPRRNLAVVDSQCGGKFARCAFESSPQFTNFAWRHVSKIARNSDGAWPTCNWRKVVCGTSICNSTSIPRRGSFSVLCPTPWRP